MAQALGPPPPPPGEVLPPAPAPQVLSQESAQTPFVPRFRFTLGILIGVALAALLVGALIVAAGSARQQRSSWSPWQPSSSGDEGLKEIGDHVAPSYQLPDGRQLVAVRGGPLSLQLDKSKIPLKILLQQQSSLSYAEGKSALFEMAGTGPQGAVDTSPASLARALLLRREALELALYSFRFQDTLQNVVVLFPPKPGEKPSIALYFRRADLSNELDQPLSSTLPGSPPSMDALLGSPQGGTVQQLTGARTFKFAFEQTQDLSAAIVLTPPPK